MLPRRNIPGTPPALALRSGLLALSLLLGSSFLPAQNRPSLAQASPQRIPGGPHGLPNRPGGEHLAQWMQRHSNLSLPEQQRALEREPGFHDLAPEAQQRMRNRLTELNNMSPERRQHLIDRTEAMERLAPEQRQQIRGTMQQLQALPQGSRRAVSRAFRDYRDLPPAQRAAALRSGQFSAGLSPEERSTFNSLVGVEPYLPPPAPRIYGPQPPGPQPGPYQQTFPQNGFQPSQPR